ncbi:MAG: hypothetical protein QOE70_1475 [Chthoniobacter sp.]|jgi:hypothetical protein|nr:hypothetical protein [Chthoniobacter sp.]
MPRRFAPLLLAVLLSGCATFDQAELARVRARGVAPPVVLKLDRGDPLAPADVVELTRRGVPDSLVIRQLEDHGVDSLVSRSDVVALRKAGVRPAVMDALLRASDYFAERYTEPGFDVYTDPYYGGGLGYYDPRWYGGVGFGVSVPLHHHHHWHR